MDKVQHDFIIIDPVKATGILKKEETDVNVGIVKGFGSGYWENACHVPQIEVKIGSKVLFTQHMQFEVEGEKIFVVRGRDIVMVKDESKA